MQLFRDFPSGSNSFLHDASYDYYGRRLASASSDHRIMIFDRDNSGSGGWKKSGEISRAHSGSILKIDWAHPEYGALLASCSTDRTAQIYQEIVEPKASTWKKQARLVDSRDAVTDVAFAPRHLGLRVATASLDGKIRIYESNDINNLSVWSPADEFEAIKGGSAVCISWNSSPFDPPMMAVAADSTVKIWASNVSSKSSNSNKWTAICELSGHSDVVHDVAWAPNPGRTFHLIATASKDGFVRIFKISLKNNPAAGGDNNNPTTSMVWECVARLGGHKSAVWRVSWNVIGTMLASSGDDGSTRIWKSDHRGQWQHVMIAAPNPLHYQQINQQNAVNEQKSQPSIPPPSVSSSTINPFGVGAFSQGNSNAASFGSSFGHTS